MPPDGAVGADARQPVTGRHRSGKMRRSGSYREGNIGSTGRSSRGAMQPRAQLDSVLRRAVDAVEVPGVVAMGHMLNLQPGPDGRSAGTVSWGGLFNTYYWIDPSKRVTGVMTQILPFADPRALQPYGQFDSGVYDALNGA